MVDKKMKLKKLSSEDYNILELGCGPTRRIANSLTIDIVDLNAVDIVADINKGLSFIPDETIDEIHSSHFLEHVDNLEFVMGEIYRVLKKGGKKIGTVPHFSNPHYYSDYTHKTFFGLYTFYYMSKRSSLKRKVPNFYNNLDFEVINIRYNFYSPFIIRNYIKRIFTKIFNLNQYTQELYEEHFCYLFPANELSFILKK